MPKRPPPEIAAQALPAGDAHHLGAQVLPGPAGGVSFAVWAPEATQVWLCLFDASGTHETQRHRLVHCSNGVWHGWLAGAAPGLVYGWRVHGPWAPQQGQRFNPQRLLLDPYAQQVVGQYSGDLCRHLGHDPADPERPHPLDNAAIALKARVVAPLPPVAQRKTPPVAPEQRVVAEVHVKSATALHPGIPKALRGTYAALAHPVMIEHWKRLGVTTLEFLPLQQRADEARLQALGLSNHWGYSTLAYLAPEPRYASQPGGAPSHAGHVSGHSRQQEAHAAQELRQTCLALREAGFELWLDVVFNHTAENDELGPTLSWRGLANRHWYRLEPGEPALYVNWAGCGNTLNLAEPMVLRFVMDALRHWVTHFGIDGFRFDLATALARNQGGEFDAGAAFFAALQADPVLRRVAWVAEPWDLGPNGYRAGEFPTGWLEWNDRCRDALRAYWLRPEDERARRAELATRLAGSSDRFAADPRRPRSPLASLNYLTSHDGFTLRDLLSFNQRHNHANGEHNQDGHHDNLSSNCGQEGPSTDAQVLATRAQLQRALLATLLLARGTPMLLGGDEIGHSQRGNNNAYCQDTPLSWWHWAEADADLPAFVARLTGLRRSAPALHAAQWLRGSAQTVGSAGSASAADSANPAAQAALAPDVSWATPDGRHLSAADWHHPSERALRVHLLADPAEPGSPPDAHPAPEWLLLFNPGEQAVPAELPVPLRSRQWWWRLDSTHPQGEPPQSTPMPPGSLSLPARSVQIWCGWP
jgi:glycogen operon protein